MASTLADIQAKYGDSVYPLYKDEMHEPYMESDNGIGYKGVVMYDELEDKVQCSECGKWFINITNTHLRSHKLTPTEYKNKNGLLLGTPLISKSLSRTKSINMQRVWEEDVRIRESFGKLRKMVKEGTNSMSSDQNRESHLKIQSKNKRGLCDAQVAARLEIVMEMMGKLLKDLTMVDVQKVDYPLWRYLTRKYGTIMKSATT